MYFTNFSLAIKNTYLKFTVIYSQEVNYLGVVSSEPAANKFN